MTKPLDWKGQEIKAGDYVVVVTMDSDTGPDGEPTNESGFHWEYKVFRITSIHHEGAWAYVQYMDGHDLAAYPINHLLKIPDHLANISARDKLELHVKLSGAWRGE